MFKSIGKTLASILPIGLANKRALVVGDFASKLSNLKLGNGTLTMLTLLQNNASLFLTINKLKEINGRLNSLGVNVEVTTIPHEKSLSYLVKMGKHRRRVSQQYNEVVDFSKLIETILELENIAKQNAELMQDVGIESLGDTKEFFNDNVIDKLIEAAGWYGLVVLEVNEVKANMQKLGIFLSEEKKAKAIKVITKLLKEKQWVEHYKELEVTIARAFGKRAGTKDFTVDHDVIFMSLVNRVLTEIISEDKYISYEYIVSGNEEQIDLTKEGVSNH